MKDSQTQASGARRKSALAFKKLTCILALLLPLIRYRIVYTYVCFWSIQVQNNLPHCEPFSKNFAYKYKCHERKTYI